MADVRVEIDDVASQLVRAVDGAMPMLAEQVLADCNYYCKMDQGMLIASSQTASDLKRGELVWNTPYAKKQYYTGKPSKKPNPFASLQWAERARIERGAAWQKVAQRAIERRLT